MTNDANEENQGDFLFGGRIVPIKREGNIVYARSLRRGEEDTGEGVALQPGDRLVIPAGELVIDSRQIDTYYNPKGLGGYAPVANTVWTWYRIATEQLGFFLRMTLIFERYCSTRGADSFSTSSRCMIAFLM